MSPSVFTALPSIPTARWSPSPPALPAVLGEVRLFNTQTGQLIADLASTSDEMLDVEFSRDGQRLLACGADRTIRTFDVAAQKELLRIESHADWVMAAAFSPDALKDRLGQPR